MLNFVCATCISLEKGWAELSKIPRAKANLFLWYFMMFDDLILPTYGSVPACVLKVSSPGSFFPWLLSRSHNEHTRHVKVYFRTPEWVQTPLVLGKDLLCACWGGSTEPHPADPCQTCSHFSEAFGPKGANNPLFAGGDGEIHGEFNRNKFSPYKSCRDYNLFLHVAFFSPLKTLKPDFSCEATGFYIRLLLNHNLQILFWLQTASHFLAEDWGKPPSSHMQGHRDPFIVSAKLCCSQGKRQQGYLQAPSEKVSQ